MKLVFLILSLLAVVSCGRKSGNTTRVGASGTLSGSAVIAGNVVIYSDCGAGPARVELGDISGSRVSEQSVNNGGSFNFQVAPGTYHLAGSTNICSVSTLGGIGVQTGYSNYRICLSQYSCKSNKLTFKKLDGASMKAASASSKFCAWKTWGCESGLIEGAESVLESHYVVQAKKQTDLGFELKFAANNHWIFTSPAMEGSGWNFQAQTDATIKIDEVSYDSLIVKSQIARASLQFDSGFCGKVADLPSQVVEYAKLHGFSDASTKGLSARVSSALPSADELCVYPQEEGQISKSLTASATKSVELRRLWFVMVPQFTTAQMKKMDKAPPQGKPAQNALLAARKASATRSVANASDVSIEDIGLGFLVQSK